MHRTSLLSVALTLSRSLELLNYGIQLLIEHAKACPHPVDLWSFQNQRFYTSLHRSFQYRKKRSEPDTGGSLLYYTEEGYRRNAADNVSDRQQLEETDRPVVSGKSMQLGTRRPNCLVGAKEETFPNAKPARLPCLFIHPYSNITTTYCQDVKVKISHRNKLSILNTSGSFENAQAHGLCDDH